MRKFFKAVKPALEGCLHLQRLAKASMATHVELMAWMGPAQMQLSAA